MNFPLSSIPTESHGKLMVKCSDCFRIHSILFGAQETLLYYTILNSCPA